jgi:membrane protein
MLAFVRVHEIPDGICECALIYSLGRGHGFRSESPWQGDMRALGITRRWHSIFGRDRSSAALRWSRFLRRTRVVPQRVFDVIEITVSRVLQDNLLDLAAQVSFYFVLSLVPFLIVLAAIVGWLPSTTLWQSFAQWITDYFPSRSRQAVFATILDLTRGYTSYLSFGLLAAIWSASSGFMSLMEALSVACCSKDTRGYWKKRAIATVATLVASLFCLLGFALWTIGHWATRAIFAEFKYVGGVHFRWSIVAWWVGTVVLMFAGLAFMNHFLTDTTRRWRWFTAGNVFSVAGILLVSIGFNLFLSYSPTVPQVYTVLAGFVVPMTWIYVVTLLVLIGTELDTALKEYHQRK